MYTHNRGNIWKFHRWGFWVVVTTNGIIKNNGELVMGAGIAKTAAENYPNLPRELGAMVRERGNQPFAFPQYRLYTFPTKNHWREDSSLELIVQSARILAQLADVHPALNATACFPRSSTDFPIYLPAVGCGRGNLNWETQVEPLLSRFLDNRFSVVLP